MIHLYYIAIQNKMLCPVKLFQHQISTNLIDEKESFLYGKDENSDKKNIDSNSLTSLKLYLFYYFYMAFQLL